MYLVVDEVEFTSLKNLSFSPQTDLTGSSIPINTFSVDVVTDQSIDVGETAVLKDDLDNLWAKYLITSSERIDPETLKVECKSMLYLCEGYKLDAVMYNGASLASVLDYTLVIPTESEGLTITLDYTLDSSFSGQTVTGYCPEQTPRERLVWICFAIGAYVKTYFNGQIEILPIPTTETSVPLEKTYWRPSLTYRDYVTSIKVKYYSFAEGTPTTTDKYVTVGETHYIVTESEMSLTNTNAPSGFPKNELTIEGVYLVNSGNANAVLNFLGRWHFNRQTVDADVIDNAEFMPGQKLSVFTDPETIVSGFVDEASFEFGKQAKARLHLIATVGVDSSKLTILYKWDTIQIGKATYSFPEGFAYSITNPYIDMSMDGHRYIFRPINAACTGTMGADDETKTEQETPALDLYNKVLHIISVDEWHADHSEQSGNSIEIGVIA